MNLIRKYIGTYRCLFLIIAYRFHKIDHSIVHQSLRTSSPHEVQMAECSMRDSEHADRSAQFAK